MSGIAEVLLNMGYNVSGSDLAETPVTERLRVLGAAVAVGHAAENVRGAQVVVASSAISRENPEIVEAQRSGEEPLPAPRPPVPAPSPLCGGGEFVPVVDQTDLPRRGLGERVRPEQVEDGR